MKNTAKKIAWILWKGWFYLLVLVVIVILSPLLILSLSTEKTYSFFFKLAKIWAYIVYYGTGFSIRYKTPIVPLQEKNYLFVANHNSMMDIMLMLILVNKPFVFVGKQELANIPIFGYFYKKSCILVDRKSAASRQQTMKSAAEKLSKGLSVCIFPEGGVSDDKTLLLDSFKDGAFRLAIEFQLPIQPYCFVGLRGGFPFDFFGGKPKTIDVFQLQLYPTKGLTSKDKEELKINVRNEIYETLLQYPFEEI
ncbi:lysophospholipid acyltransferase family protein [Capnocytophaga sp. ARDL2]|uniref:lysophospholipid acyltransferase family protein n=1 Tax=Capnocytophaga sp. ARDL2 TaxID=3238809 RepID=UPI003557E780